MSEQNTSIRKVHETDTEHASLPKTKYQEEIDIIASQTGVDDKLSIERIFMECHNDTSLTIIKLMNLVVEEPKTRETTVFDDIRIILNEKDAIYHDIMNNKAKDS